MAIDDVSFYTVTGEEISRNYLVEQMINYYLLKLQAGETRVTDFNEGSEIRNLLEAIAVDNYIMMEEKNNLTEIGFIDSAEGEWLDKHGAKPEINMPRDTGNEAVGFVTFSIPAPLTSDLIIPEQTIVVSSEEDLEFITDGDCLISVGELSNTIGVTCLTTGLNGNVPAGSIDLIDDDLVDASVSVTNQDPLINGTDYEEDDEYRERLLAYVRQDDFGSVGYYTRICEEIDGVHDVVLIDEEVEPGEQKQFTKIILVNGDNKPVEDTVIINVLDKVTNPANKVINHNFKVEPVNATNVNLTLNLTVQEELNPADILKTLTAYFNGGNGFYILEFEGLYINENLYYDKLTDVVYMMDGISDVEIINTATGETFTEIQCPLNSVFKPGEIIINQTIGE